MSVRSHHLRSLQRAAFIFIDRFTERKIKS
jgi:hypothetical protein